MRYNTCIHYLKSLGNQTSGPCARPLSARLPTINLQVFKVFLTVKFFKFSALQRGRHRLIQTVDLKHASQDFWDEPAV